MAAVNFNYPKFKYTIASTGQPGAGYKLFTYEEGTSTKKTTWTSLAKTAENTNPVVLDANGEADVWIDGNYKFVLAPPTDTDPPASAVWTYDAVRSPADAVASDTVGASAPANGSFETDADADGEPDNWTVVAYSGGTVELDTTTSTHGDTSLKFTSIGAGGGSAITEEYYEVEAGRVVSVRFSIISADADTLNKVQINWYNTSQTYLSTSDAYNEGAANPTTWTRKYTSVTAPATAKYAKLLITGVDPLSTTHSSTNFDNIELATGFTGEITAAPPELNILDGATLDVNELNILDGATITVTELNYLDGSTENVQTALDVRTTKLILETTVSAPVASVSFQDGVSGVVFDSTYDAYMVQMVNVVPATDAVVLYGRVYVGGVVQSGAADYSGATAQITLTGVGTPVGSAAGEGMESRIFISNPSSTTQRKRLDSYAVYTDSSGAEITLQTGGSYVTAANAVDGVQFYFSSGNIESGTIRLYGVSY